MIDDREMKELSKLHPRNRKPACIFEKDKAIVHSQWFVLELPKEEINVTTEWPGKPLEFIRQWKYEQLPQDVAGETAQPMRGSWDAEDDEEPTVVIQLMSENLQGTIDPELYEFVRRQIEHPEFKLYPGQRADGSPPNVGVFVDDQPVGVVAQIVKSEDQQTHGWKTSL